MLWLSLAIIFVVLAVGWLARHRHKKKETEIRAIKGSLKEAVKQTCEAAKKGDSEASIRLEAFKESITEQSVRMTGKPKPPTTIVPGTLQCVLVAAVLALALAEGGCGNVDHNTVTEEDRVIVDMNIQIAKKRQAAMRMLVSAIGNDPAGYASAFKEVEQLDTDALANNEQLQKNWKAPDKPVEYTPPAAKQARENSEKVHTETGLGFWAKVASGFGAGVLFLLGVARSPLAKFIPGVGSISTALDTTMTGIETWMAAKKASGEGVQADDLAEVLQLAHAHPAVAKVIDKRLAKIKDKLGIGDEEEPPALAAILTPAPAAPVAAARPDDETKILTPPLGEEEPKPPAA